MAGHGMYWQPSMHDLPNYVLLTDVTDGVGKPGSENIFNNTNIIHYENSIF